MSQLPIHFELAKEQDDADIRKLLRESPMVGSISLTFEREPNFFIGSSIEGDFHEIILARDEKGELAGMGSRHLRKFWFNGEVHEMGYLSQLRVSPHFRSFKKSFAGSYAKLKSLQEARPVKYYVTSLLAENVIAQRLLTSKKLGLPNYDLIGKMSTFALLPKSKCKGTPDWVVGEGEKGFELNKNFEILTATGNDLENLVTFINNCNSKFQFMPVWNVKDLNSSKTKGLKLENILIAKSNGKIVGSLALWDQNAYKQTRVKSYSTYLKVLRPILNIFSRFTGVPHLPRSGELMPYVYLSLLAVENNREDVFLKLIQRAQTLAPQGTSYLSLGLSQDHPLYNCFKKYYNAFEFKSLIYLVYWGEREIPLNENYQPMLEIAVL